MDHSTSSMALKAFSGSSSIPTVEFDNVFALWSSGQEGTDYRNLSQLFISSGQGITINGHHLSKSFTIASFYIREVSLLGWKVQGGGETRCDSDLCSSDGCSS